MGPAQVRSRDGATSPFDVEHLRASLLAASARSGEPLLVEPLLEAVVLFLDKAFRDRIPTTEDIQDLVERALLDASQPLTADAYAARFRERSERRDGLVVLADEDPAYGEDGELSFEPEAAPFATTRLASSLVRKGGLDRRKAEEVAAAVEEMVLAVGLRRVPGALLRALVRAELRRRGLPATLHGGGEVVYPFRALRRRLLDLALDRSGSGSATSPEAAVGADLLARYALAELLPAETAQAHDQARIHILDVGRRDRLTAGAVLPTHATRGPTGGLPDAERAARDLARRCRAAARHHHRTVGLPWLPALYAPVLRGPRTERRRAARALYLALVATGLGEGLVVHLGLPSGELAGLRAPGQAGRLYGDLTEVAAELAADLREAARASDDLPPAERPQLVGEGPLAEDSAGLDHRLLGESSLPPPALAGLASEGELLAGLRSDPAEDADEALHGVAAVVAVSCPRAALRISMRGLAALEAELGGALTVAVDALRAALDGLLASLYRPPLPLWAGAAAGGGLVVPPPARLRGAVVLVGFEEALALARPTGAAEPSAAEQLALATRLAARVREEGTRRGLTADIEEPFRGMVDIAARRMAEADLALDSARVRSVAERPEGVRYRAGLWGLVAGAPDRAAACAALGRRFLWPCGTAR